MHQNQYGRSDGHAAPPPSAPYASASQHTHAQQQYYAYGYPYPNYQQNSRDQQQSTYHPPGPAQPPPPAPPAPPNKGEALPPPPPPPPPPPEAEPPPPVPGSSPEQPSNEATSNGQSYPPANVATPSTETSAPSASSTNDQSGGTYSSAPYWTTPTTTQSYWGSPASNWPHSQWHSSPPQKAQPEQGQQAQPASTYSAGQYSTEQAQQYNYTQYGNASGSGHGWSRGENGQGWTQSGGNGHGWGQGAQNPSWGWGGQQQYHHYQPNQWSNQQQWGQAGGQAGGGSEAWAGGWTAQHTAYPGNYYGQQQYQYDGNYQGYPQAPQPPKEKEQQQPSSERAPRSPGTPPLQELLSPGENKAANDGGTPTSRKHPSESSEGEPDSKRARRDQQWQSRDQQWQSRDQQWQSHDRYPPLKRVAVQPQSYNAVPPPGGPQGKRPPSNSTAFPQPPPTASPQPPTTASPRQPPQERGAPNQSENRGKFPPGFSAYVNRAFAACSSARERDELHRYLDDELNKVFNDNKQWSINWQTYPLPKFLSGNKRAASRWDTPSPSRELMNRGSPAAPNMAGVNHDSDGEDKLPTAFGRGRGKRKKKFKGKKGKNKFFIDNQPAFEFSAEEKQKMSLRTQRFGRQGAEGNRNVNKKLSIDELLKSVNVGGSEDSVGWEGQALEGTSQSLEKQYLRLTSAPDPSTVRPLSVLKRAYDHVMSRWKSTGDYHYTCEQFKSIRQDLTLQTIRNEFTVLVYETHARIALEKSDRGEFNQCQTQLKALYHEGTHGNQAEFIAYRILYQILTDNTAELSSLLKELTSDLRHNPCVDHAIRVHQSWFLNDYHQFFKLYRSSPNLSRSLIDMFVDRERKAALKSMAKAYRPTLPVWYIAQELEFDATDDCVAFLTDLGVVLDPAYQSMDCKLSVSKLL